MLHYNLSTYQTTAHHTLHLTRRAIPYLTSHSYKPFSDLFALSLQSHIFPRPKSARPHPTASTNLPPQVTGPVSRFARQIASQGYIVAAPSSYHEFTGPEPLAYDGPGTDKGNEWKVRLLLPPIPFRFQAHSSFTLLGWYANKE
jgi:hypothetical protein